LIDITALIAGDTASDVDYSGKLLRKRGQTIWEVNTGSY